MFVYHHGRRLILLEYDSKMNWTFYDQDTLRYYIPKVELFHHDHHKRKQHLQMVIFDIYPKDDVIPVAVTVLP